MPSRGTAAVRQTIAPAAVPVSPAPARNFEYAFIVALITVCCLAVEIMAPADWRPTAAWLLLAPAIGLVAAGIPALIVARRFRNAEKITREKDDLIGLLLKDYAGERSDWVWSSDAEGRLRGVSRKFALQAGRKVALLEGALLADLLGEARRGEQADGNEITACMRQRQPFYNLEARIMVGGEECNWRMAGKPAFHDGRFAGYVGTAANITSEFRARATMTYLAYNDGLTGLANRAHFQRRLSECVARLDRYGTAFTLLYIDLDKFKAVNDNLGHQAGDQLLIEVSKRLGAQVRKADLVARLGGDEFALLLPDESNPGSIANLATRMIEQISQPFSIDGNEVSVGVSIGIAIAPANGGQAEQIVRSADLALYRAKAEGGDSYCFFEAGMDAAAHEQHELETELGEALGGDELVLHYQPMIAAADGVVCGLEATMRWNHPTRGLIPPDDFAVMAERPSLVGRIGRWKILEGCRALARLPEHMTVAVDLSAKQFTGTDVAAIVAQALDETQVAAHRLQIEIGESLLIEDAGDAATSLAALKDLGVTICLDHFGTGVSSLSCLRRGPFDRLKLDRSLLAGGQPEALELVKGIVALAGSLDIAVACEGVGTAEQAELLGKAGAKVLQGDFLAQPKPLDDIMLAAGVAPAAPDRRGVAVVG